MTSPFTKENTKEMRFYVSTGAVLFTAVALYQTLKFQAKIVRNQHKRELVSSGKVSRLADLQKLSKGKLVMLSGTVDTADQNPIKVQIDKKTELLALRLLYKQSIYSNESYDLQKKDYNINLNQVLKGSNLQFNPNITLNEGFKGVLIKNVDKIDFSPALEILKWENKRRQLTLFENITSLFMSVLRGVATLGIKDRDVTFLRGIEIGTRQVDTGIRIGASLTVLGTLGMTTDGTLFIEPSAIFKQRFTFLHELSQKLQELTSKRNFWLGALVVGAIYAGRRTYIYIRKNKIKLPWERKIDWEEVEKKIDWEEIEQKTNLVEDILEE